MALYQSTVTADALRSAGNDRTRVLRGVAYAGTLQTAARLAGDTRTTVTVSSIRAFQARHPDSAIVTRALDRNKWPAVVLASAGGTAAGSRWARASLTPATRLALDRNAVLDSDRDRVAVMVTATPRSAAAERTQALRTGVQAIAVLGTAGPKGTPAPAVSANIVLPPVIGNYQRQRGKGKRARAANAQPRAKRSKQKQSAVDDEAEEDDEEATSGEGEGEPEGGIDLDQTAEQDEAQSVGEYDMTDGFIVEDEEEGEQMEEDDFTGVNYGV